MIKENLLTQYWHIFFSILNLNYVTGKIQYAVFTYIFNVDGLGRKWQFQSILLFKQTQQEIGDNFTQTQQEVSVFAC